MKSILPTTTDTEPVIETASKLHGLICFIITLLFSIMSLAILYANEVKQLPGLVILLLLVCVAAALFSTYLYDRIFRSYLQEAQARATQTATKTSKSDAY